MMKEYVGKFAIDLSVLKPIRVLSRRTIAHLFRYTLYPLILF